MRKVYLNICFLISILSLIQCREMNDRRNVKITLNCINLEENHQNKIEVNGFRIDAHHRIGEPPNSNRILISRKNLEIEILPSKGFSIGSFLIDNKPVLWDAPIGLPDPANLDFLTDEISVNGKPSPGFTYLRTFVGGIELLGMTNWGMPRIDTLTGRFLPLHGEVSNIPLDSLEIEISKKGLIAKGTIIYRNMLGDSGKPWWKRGSQMYRITKSLIVDLETKGVKLADTITNISNEILIPDWGYHVTFSPESGSKLLVPSLKIEDRNGGSLPGKIDTWYPAKNEKIRNEIGIIHKELKSFSYNGNPYTSVLKLYPDGRAFRLTIPITPYFQTWYSCGGSDSKEFTYRDGTSVFKKSWNGFGVEFGSSSLDDNGNTDRSVSYKNSLAPGENLGIMISIEMLDHEASDILNKEINNYTLLRK